MLNSEEMSAQEKTSLKEEDLRQWDLLKQLDEELEKAQEGEPITGTHKDPRRKLTQKNYLSLLLFGLFNPVVKSMRGLCAISHLERVQKEVCQRGVSLGSFSECQQVIEPQLLEKVFKSLAREQKEYQWGDKRLKDYQSRLRAIDSTLWKALPRMKWAFWREQKGHKESALRMHVSFNILEQKPVDVVIAGAKKCERAALREQLERGAFYVGDRYYGEQYALFDELIEGGCDFVIRLRKDAAIHVVKELALSEEDRAGGVISDQIVQLGHRKKTQTFRLVRVAREEGKEDLLLLTNKKEAQELEAVLVGLIYKYRWQVELFFKWFKCILGARHWFAESPQGVAIQIYCVLIAALLLFRATGQRPNKRMMEMIQFYMMGYASLEEMTRQIKKEKERIKNLANRKKSKQ